MAQKQNIQLDRQTNASAAKETAAQLVGKSSQAPSKVKTWTQTFAASGGKVGGKQGT